MTPRYYRDTRTVDAWDTLSGVTFADPYRWLEADSEEVRQWQREQAQIASRHVRQWPHFERLRQLVKRYPEPYLLPLPRFAGNSWFRMEVTRGESHARVIVSDAPMGEGRVLFDPINENATRPPVVCWISPSPDRRTLALGVCADGSETNTIRLVDVLTGQLLADPPRHVLMDGTTGEARWLPDSSGFFFGAITGRAVDFALEVYLHRRMPAPTTLTLDIPWTQGPDWRMVAVSQDGRYAIASERGLTPIPVAIAELGQWPLKWRPFVTSVAGTLAGHLTGNRYLAVTDVDAPRGRLVAVRLDAGDPNDPDTWQELVPESDAVLGAVSLIGEALYLAEHVETYTRIRIFDLDGGKLGEVPLPGRGTVGVERIAPLMSLLSKGQHPTKFLFTFSTLTVSAGIYSHTLGQDDLETLQEPDIRLANTLVEDRWAASPDGTRIPYHLVRRLDVEVDRPQPTLIYAYGGFGFPLAPRFPGPMAAFVAAGGIFVHAHLRGGGEFGREWWEGGRMRNTQNSYDDLYAVAEDLIAANICTPPQLAVTGGSHGGLMAGVAVTQRPDLWKVAVPRVPLLDLIGACREPYGRMGMLLERANIDNPDEVRRLATFSPYHLVREGVRYPAVYIDAGDTDVRTPAWHARKFVARMQRATQGTAPVLLHVWDHVGHGGATDPEITIDEHTEWLAFVMRHLGLEPSAENVHGAG